MPTGIHVSVRNSLRIRLAMLSLLAVFLTWEVVSRSVTAYFADADPKIAVRLKSTHPSALLGLADLALKNERAVKRSQYSAIPQDEKDNQAVPEIQNRDGSPDEFLSSELSSAGKERDLVSDALIRSWTKQALVGDPLNASGFRILGQLAEGIGEERQAEKFMKTAIRRSLHQGEAAYWMMYKSYQDQKYQAAVHYADILLRIDHDLPQYVIPILGRIADTPDGVDELEKVLAHNPPWRWRFFNDIPHHVADARTPLELLMRLKGTSNPPTLADARSYLDFLVRHGFYELAYYTWLQFLPQHHLSEAGPVFNAGFEAKPSGAPFDWVFNEGSGVAISVPSLPEGGRALFLSFGPGRVDFEGVTQLVYLGTGDYTLRGRYKADIVSQRGLQWSVTCAGQPTPIGQSLKVVNESGDVWKDFEFTFTVPDAECAAQYVRLSLDARSASEQFVSGSIWYDDLEVSREPDSGETNK